MNKKIIPILLVLVFTVPMFASFILFQYHEKFSLKTTNRGQLITPPILTSFLHKWQMLYICESDCENVFHSLEQVKKVFGKDSERIQVQQKKLKELGIDALHTNKIYLIDPRGNLFMVYDHTENPMNILKDLKKVLGASQIG